MANPEAEELCTEGVIRLGIKCMEDMTREYLSKHTEQELISYQNYLKYQLTFCHWLRSIVDPDEVIGCMERVRKEKLRTDEEYREQWLSY